MNKLIVFSLCVFFGGFSAFAQYTETINSNRPGNSQGAFAVGFHVLQLETGVRYGHKNHYLRKTETNLFGVDYSLRFGFTTERLEVSLMGSYLAANQTYRIGANDTKLKFRNFKSNTLGIKYLIYDPYKKRSMQEPNIRSWDANHNFQWYHLIPAISIYGGANILFGDNPYRYPGESNISPKIALITQHNYKRWVFVMNFIADKFGADFPIYTGIFTLTHALSRTVSIFGEYQAIKNHLYSDDIFRFGTAYLVNKDFQVDLAGLINFKDTPSRWQVAIGFSYRWDKFHENEYLIPEKEKEEDKEKIKKNQL